MPLALFHDGIVDRRGRDRGVEVERHVETGKIAGRRRVGSFGGLPDVRLEIPEGVAHGAGAKQENAGVPVEIAAGEVLLRGRQIGFFDETRDIEMPCLPAGDLDIAVTGFRLARLDAEHHEPAGLRAPERRFPCVCQNCRFGRNLMIGGNDQHQAVARADKRAQRGDGNGGGRIAPGRLEDRAAAGKVDAREIGMDAVGVPLRRQSGRSAFRPPASPSAAASVLASIEPSPEKSWNCFGIVLARQRPQP